MKYLNKLTGQDIIVPVGGNKLLVGSILFDTNTQNQDKNIDTSELKQKLSEFVHAKNDGIFNLDFASWSQAHLRFQLPGLNLYGFLIDRYYKEINLQVYNQYNIVSVNLQDANKSLIKNVSGLYARHDISNNYAYRYATKSVYSEQALDKLSPTILFKYFYNRYSALSKLIYAESIHHTLLGQSYNSYIQGLEEISAYYNNLAVNSFEIFSSKEIKGVIDTNGRIVFSSIYYLQNQGTIRNDLPEVLYQVSDPGINSPSEHLASESRRESYFFYYYFHVIPFEFLLNQIISTNRQETKGVYATYIHGDKQYERYDGTNRYSRFTRYYPKSLPLIYGNVIHNNKILTNTWSPPYIDSNATTLQDKNPVLKSFETGLTETPSNQVIGWYSREWFPKTTIFDFNNKVQLDINAINIPLQHKYYTYGGGILYQLDLNSSLNAQNLQRNTINIDYLYFSGQRLYTYTERYPEITYNYYSNSSTDYATIGYVKNQYNNVESKFINWLSNRQTQISQNAILYLFNPSTNKYDIAQSFDLQNISYPNQKNIIKRNFRTFPSEPFKITVDGTSNTGLTNDVYIFLIPYQKFNQNTDTYTFEPVSIGIEYDSTTGTYNLASNVYTKRGKMIILPPDTHIQNKLNTDTVYNKYVDYISKQSDWSQLPPHNVANKFQIQNYSGELYILQASLHHGKFYKEIDVNKTPLEGMDQGIYYTTLTLYKVESIDTTTYDITASISDFLVIPGIGVEIVDYVVNPSGGVQINSMLAVDRDIKKPIKIDITFDSTLNRYVFTTYGLKDSLIKATGLDIFDYKKAKQIAFIGRVPQNNTNALLVLTDDIRYIESEKQPYVYGAQYCDAKPFFVKTRSETAYALDLLSDFTAASLFSIIEKSYNTAFDDLNITITDTKNYGRFETIEVENNQLLGILKINKENTTYQGVLNDITYASTNYKFTLTIQNLSANTITLDIEIFSYLYKFSSNLSNTITLTINPGATITEDIEVVAGEIGDALIGFTIK